MYILMALWKSAHFIQAQLLKKKETLNIFIQNKKCLRIHAYNCSSSS